MAVFQKLIDWIYDQFTTRVADARKLDKAKVLEIAQGRVWSGAEAKKIGLVDEIGGLNKAIGYAADKTHLGANFRLTEFPHRRQLAEIINDMLRDASPDQAGDDAALRRVIGELKDDARVLLELNDPRGAYARLPVNIVIQ
jgi:protease-4